MKNKESQEQDAQLVESCCNGNQTAFNSLVEKYYARFCEDIGYKFPALKEDAGEIVNDSFLEFHADPQQIEKPGSIYSWLKKVIYHECIRRKEAIERLDELLDKLSDKLLNDMEPFASDLADELINQAGEEMIDYILHAFFNDSNGSLLSNKIIKRMQYKKIARIEIEEGKSNESTIKQSEENVEKKIVNRANAIKTQVNDLRKTLAILVLAYSDAYFDKFLTAEEIGKKLNLPVTEVTKRLSSAHKQYDEHFKAAFKLLASKKRKIFNLRVPDDWEPRGGQTFKMISGGNSRKENLKVQKQWYDAKTELENELIKMKITNTIKERISTRKEKMVEKRKRSA